MTGNEPRKLPDLRSMDELVRFFDDNDLGDYLDTMPEAHFDVELRHRKHLLALEPQLAEKISGIARAKHLSSEELIHAWLQEKVLEEA